MKKTDRKKKTAKQKKEERIEALETAYEACSIDGEVTVKDLAEYLETTEKTVRNHLKEHGDFNVNDGYVKQN